MREKNIKLAEEGIKYARNIIKRSSTSLESNNLSEEALKALHLEVEGLRNSMVTNPDKVVVNLYKFLGGTHGIAARDIKSVVTRVKNSSIGNCYEYAVLAVNFFKKQGVNQAEVFCIKNDDHVFAVIGRASGSDPNNPETWGDEAIICDAWSNNVYPAKDYLNHLSCYFFDKSQCKNTVYPFDKLTHSVQKRELITGGNDEVTKNKMISDTVSELNLIKQSISQLAIQENKKLSMLLNKIEKGIQSLESSRDSFSKDSKTTNFQVERQLSKVIRGIITQAQTIAKELNLQEQLNDALITAWINERKNQHLKEKTPEIVVMTELWQLLTTLDSKVTIPLVRSLSDDLLNRIVYERRWGGFNLLRFILQNTKIDKERYFTEVLSKLNFNTIRKLIGDDQTLLKDIHAVLGESKVVELLNQIPDGEINTADLNTDRTLLTTAVVNNQPEVVRILLNNKKINADTPDLLKDTALTLAIKLGHLDLVKSLISHLEKEGGDFSSGRLNELFDLAVQHHQLAIIKCLIYETKLDFNDISSLSLRKTRDLAIKHGDLEIFKSCLSLLEKNGLSSSRELVAMLNMAVAHGQVEIVNYLINEKEVAFDLPDQNGFRPLHIAAQNGHEELVRILLDKGANANQITLTGFTAGALARQNQHLTVEHILNNHSKELAFFKAAEEENVSEVENLLKTGACFNMVNIKNNLTIIETAILQGKLKLLQNLINFADQSDDINLDLDKLLSMAVSFNQLKVVEYLITENGAKPNFRNQRGLTPLHTAAINNNKEIVSFLLQQGANPNVASINLNNPGFDGRTPAAIAFLHGNVEIGQMLQASSIEDLFFKAVTDGRLDDINKILAQGIMLSTKELASGLTAIELAVINGQLEVAKFLFEKNKLAYSNNAPYLLNLAVEKGQLELTNYFMELIENNQGRIISYNDIYNLLIKSLSKGNLELTRYFIDFFERENISYPGSLNYLLHLAVGNDKMEIVRYLLEEKKVEPNTAFGIINLTPLHLAVEKGSTEMVAILLENKADITVKNARGETVLDIAKREGNPKMVELLSTSNREEIVQSPKTSLNESDKVESQEGKRTLKKLMNEGLLEIDQDGSVNKPNKT